MSQAKIKDYFESLKSSDEENLFKSCKRSFF